MQVWKPTQRQCGINQASGPQIYRYQCTLRDLNRTQGMWSKHCAQDTVQIYVTHLQRTKSREDVL